MHCGMRYKVSVAGRDDSRNVFAIPIGHIKVAQIDQNRAGSAHVAVDEHHR